MTGLPYIYVTRVTLAYTAIYRIPVTMCHTPQGRSARALGDRRKKRQPLRIKAYAAASICRTVFQHLAFLGRAREVIARLSRFPTPCAPSAHEPIFAVPKLPEGAGAKMSDSPAEPLPRVPLAYLVGGDPDAEPDAVQWEQLLLATLIAHGWKGRTREPTLRACHFSEPIHAGVFAAMSFGDRTRIGSGHRAPGEYVDGLVSIARDADEVSALERVVIGNWLRTEMGRLARTLACESEAKRLDGYELVELAISRMDRIKVI